ncbi:MAG: hypothetical protein GF315_10325 [candidate division Zixibacteria bacterium]|nr:hypothetical protein [candidate division Zixibacteria bacterium]
MITYLNSNLFTSPAKVLVNTVNTEGVMGKGIAKDFKMLFPEMFKEYQSKCERGELDIGKLHLYKTPNKWILNFPTKKHWRQRSKIEYIEAGLRKFRRVQIPWRIFSISFPRLGCGNGELDWESQVKPKMEKYLSDLPVDTFIHLSGPNTTIPEHENKKEMKKWLSSEPELLPFSEVWEDIKQALNGQNPLNSINGAVFKSFIIEDPVGLKIERNGDTFTIPYEELLTLWQILREKGVLTIYDMYRELDGEYEYLFVVFSLLDYVNPVLVSSKRDLDKEPQSPGLLYKARTSKHQIELIPF